MERQRLTVLSLDDGWKSMVNSDLNTPEGALGGFGCLRDAGRMDGPGRLPPRSLLAAPNEETHPASKTSASSPRSGPHPAMHHLRVPKGRSILNTCVTVHGLGGRGNGGYRVAQVDRGKDLWAFPVSFGSHMAFPNGPGFIIKEETRGGRKKQPSDSLVFKREGTPLSRLGVSAREPLIVCGVLEHVLSNHSSCLHFPRCRGRAEGFNLNEVQIIHFLKLTDSAFGVKPKQWLANSKPQMFLLRVSLRSFIVGDCTFRSMLRFELIFIYGVRYRFKFT